MDLTKMSPELLQALAGIILSLLFSYVPTINVWFASKSPELKRVMMLGLIVVVGAGVGGLSCANVLTTVPCTVEGWMSILQAVIVVAITNQTAYSISPQVRAVREAAAAARLRAYSKA